MEDWPTAHPGIKPRVCSEARIRITHHPGISAFNVYFPHRAPCDRRPVRPFHNDVGCPGHLHFGFGITESDDGFPNRTWRFNQGVSDPDFGRGDGFIANGKIFPVFTLHPGEQTNDPNDPGSIGTFIENGTMAATLLEIIDGKRPAFVGTWYHLLDDGRGLVAAGPHPDSGPMAVIGGMGRFSGASGDLDVEILGYNTTGCPNMRLTFNLKNLAPK